MTSGRRAAGFVGIAHRGIGARPLRCVQRGHIFAQRTFARGNRRPVVVEVLIVHADHQLGFRDIREPLLDKSPLHFARLHHRLEAIAAAQLAPAFAEGRHRVDHHAHGGHAAEMVPHDGCDDAARPHDAAHFGHGLAGFRHKVEHEQRQCAVERSVLEGQGAGIRLLDLDARISVAPICRLYEDGRIVDGADLAEIGELGQRERQAAGAAADVKNVFAVGKPHEVYEQWREFIAPAAHELLIAGRIVNVEA